MLCRSSSTNMYVYGTEIKIVLPKIIGVSKYMISFQKILTDFIAGMNFSLT